MFSFEGEFRKKPQALRGNRAVEQRDQILQRAAEARRQREELKRKTEKSIKIQALVRRFLTRSRVNRRFREELELAKQQLGRSRQVARVLYFIRSANLFMTSSATEGDYEQAIFLAQCVLKCNCLEECSKDPLTAFTLAKFLAACLRLAAGTTQLTNPHVNLVLRVLEIFLVDSSLPESVLNTICRCLVTRCFFGSCMEIMNKKSRDIPLLQSSKAPTEFHASLLRLMMRPLNVLLKSSSSDAKLVVLYFCQEVLAAQMDLVLRSFILPALANPQQHLLPITTFLAVLSALINDPVQGAPLIHSTNRSLCVVLLILINEYGKELTQARNPLVLSVVNFALNPGRRGAPDQDEDETSRSRRIPNEDDSDDDSEEIVSRKEPKPEAVDSHLWREIDQILESPSFISTILASLDVNNEGCVEDAAGICMALVMFKDKDKDREDLSPPTLFYKFAFNMSFLRALWKRIETCDLVENLKSSLTSNFAASKASVKLYSVFARLLVCTMATVYDDEFTSSTPGSAFEFSLEEVISIAGSARDVATGVVFLAYATPLGPPMDSEYPALMSHLFSSVVLLIKELHDRDARRSFCPEEFWMSQRLSSLADKTKRSGSVQFIYGVFEKTNPFRPLRDLSQFGGAAMDEVRFSLVLDQVPCLIPFYQRLLFVYMTLKAEKANVRSELDFLRPEGHIQVKVRRDRIYEDAFADLSPEVVPDMHKSIKVTFQNLAGLDEAGVDGGGLFREFMYQTVRAGFDANRGIFRYNEDRALYPNPEATVLFRDYQKHFFFLGRLLGKAIYENLLTEVHFADFFLKKLLSKNSVGNVDIHYLKSLDPMLFKNLLYLKQYPGDVADLQLDFSVVVDELGVMKELELKPGGKSVAVTKENVVEYIFLVADFKLNRQIRLHTACFRNGLNDVVPIQLLQIFNFKELQTLISGTQEPIDVRDWRKNTLYGNPYSDDHPTIQAFWKIVQSFSEATKRSLLRFVTSCSRPPLLGFKDLPHKFTINPVHEEDRLPTASTCMNLLKLPNIRDEEKLREKLLYAVQSEAGFELS